MAVSHHGSTRKVVVLPLARLVLTTSRKAKHFAELVLHSLVGDRDHRSGPPPSAPSSSSCHPLFEFQLLASGQKAHQTTPCSTLVVLIRGNCHPSSYHGFVIAGALGTFCAQAMVKERLLRIVKLLPGCLSIIVLHTIIFDSVVIIEGGVEVLMM